MIVTEFFGIAFFYEVCYNPGMKISYCSDLHLDFGPGLELPGGEVLILAGDVVEHNRLKHSPELQNFFQTECAKYQQVFYILGNHEHYNGTFSKTLERMQEFMPDNIRLMENDCINYKGINFVGCTLWTDMNKQDPLTLYQMPNLINDYRCVKNEYQGGYGKLTPRHTASVHFQSVEYLKETLESVTVPTVVFTHHAPTLESINVRYRTAKDHCMNGGYASDLSQLILDYTDKVPYWIHGHMHNEVDYLVGNTRVLSNPRGYLPYEAQALSFAVKDIEI